ncbi:MAG: S-layer homology domain-containing protein [Tissierellia bacterium]|nr:S-layer homology domain-containing protein [Tissierellia bacterium]
MRKEKSKYLRLLFILMLILGIIIPTSIFAAEKPFTRIFNTKIKGEIKITGNTLQRPADKTEKAENALAGKTTDGNNQFKMKKLDVDTDAGTSSSSSANLVFAPKAKVEKAFLVWGATTTGGTPATVNAGHPPTIKFKTPKSKNYQVISPTGWNQFSEGKKDYSAYADVTELVKSGGAGTYWGADIPQSTDATDRYGGWSLVVVFQNDDRPKNDLSIFFGHKVVKNTTGIQIPITGIQTPAVGPVHAKVGFVAWEGDAKYNNDHALINVNGKFEELFNQTSPKDNFFNSTISDNGAYLTNRNPAYVNNMGIDAKIINIDGKLKNSATSAKFKFDSGGDWYYPTILTSEIEMYAPDLKVTKTVENLSGHTPAKEGDILEYTVHFENIGIDTAMHTVAKDLIPDGLEYVPGTIKVTNGQNSGPRTDAKDDDSAEYDTATKNLILRVGNNPTNNNTDPEGGSLEHEQVYEAKFQAKILPEGVGSPLTNEIKVTYDGTDGTPANTGLDGSGSVTTPTEEANPQIKFTKTSNKDSSYRLVKGETITYTFTVENTGNVTLKDAKVTDPMEGLNPKEIKLDKTTLAPGGVATASATYTITQDDVDAGKVENTATATVKPPRGESFSTTATSTVPGSPEPKVLFTKTSDKNSDYRLIAGETITYTFKVKNTGNITLKDLTLNDPMKGLKQNGKEVEGGVLTLDKTTLAPEETATATATYLITQADVDKGSVTNKAITKMKTPDGTEIQRDATATVPASPGPDATFEKTTDKKPDYNLKVGDTIEYTFTLTNTGNLTLKNLSLTDEMPGLSTPTFDKTELAPGGVATAKATYTITQIDVDKGSVTNNAVAKMTTPDGKEMQRNATATVPSKPSPDFTFEKTTDKKPSYRLKVGDVITYTFKVKNTGNVTLNNVQVTDPMPNLSSFTFNNVTLAPGETETATATYTITQADVDNGAINNTATATVTPPSGTPIEKDASARVPASRKPNFTFTKTSDKDDNYELVLNDVIEYTFTITNTGNVTLKDFTVTDPMIEPQDITLQKTELAPDESTTGTASYTIKQSDVDKGQIENTATATAKSPSGKTIENDATDMVPASRKPDFTITKTADMADTPSLKVGNTITYTFTLTNTGNVTLTNVGIEDPLEGLSDITLDKTTLAPGEVATGTATYEIKQSDVDAGEVENTAKGMVNTPSGKTMKKSVTEVVTINQNPKIVFKKSTDKASDYELKAGEVITYTFIVTNDGNVTVDNVVVTDPMEGLSKIDLDKTKLAPGETATATATYTIKQKDVDKGQITNIAKASVTPPQGGPIEETSTTTTPANQGPDLTFKKTTDKPESYRLVKDDVITYTFTVTNTGNITLKNITVTDPMEGLMQNGGAVTDSIALDKTELAPGEMAKGVATYKITQEDVDGGKVKNTATAKSTAANGVELEKIASANVPASPEPSFTLTKTTNKKQDYRLKAGDSITYTFTVTNTGNQTLKNLIVKDEMEGLQQNNTALTEGLLTFEKTTLAPEESTTATATYKITQKDVDAGQIKNTAKGEMTTPAGEKTYGDASVSVPSERNPQFTFTKTADKTNLVLGETITYTFTVTNTGNVTLTNVNVVDELKGLSEINWDKTEIAPKGVATGTATYTITQADVDRGIVENSATATAKGPEGTAPPAPQKASVSVPSDRVPNFYFTKTTDKAPDYKLVAGETITYTFTVTNTGNVTLTDINVVDELKGLSEITWDKTEIAPKEVATGTATYTITQADVDKGQVENSATATVTPPDGVEPPIAQVASVAVPTEPNPGISITKTADKEKNKPLRANEYITYTFTVENTGNVTIHNIIIKDPMKGLPKLTLKKNTLAPGEKAFAVGTYQVTPFDVKRGWLKNTVTITGDTELGEQVKDSDTLVLGNGQMPNPGGIGGIGGHHGDNNGGHPSGKKYYIVKKNPEITLNRELHYAYMFGYPQGDFRPNRPITRAEVAVLFTRLSVGTDNPGISKDEYSDVIQDKWYADAVNYLSHKGIIKGYGDGTFRPNQEITRAEFAAIASRYEKYGGTGGKTFPDVKENHWAAEDINSAAGAGWINGYPDGKFKPEQKITRAEVVTIVNRILNRVGDRKFILSHFNDPKLRTFTDLQNINYWAYLDIMESTNGHDFYRLENGEEQWIELNEKDFYYDKKLKDIKENKKYY